MTERTEQRDVVGGFGAAENGAAQDVAAVQSAAPYGTSAADRAQRRGIRKRLNASENRQLITGFLATLAGGIFWGFSGTCASYLFENYAVDTAWLMVVRQLCSGALFLVFILATDRARLKQLLTTPRDLSLLAVFAASGVFLNQYFYLLAVRAMNAGTATVLQCLQLIIIMVYACLRARRGPRKRELAGVALALAGTYLLATAGNPSTLVIPPDGLAIGLIAAVGAACMSIIPTGLLARYGSSIVTGMGMLVSGLASSVIIRPWEQVPVFDAMGWGAFAVLVFVGSFLAYFLYMQGVKDIGSMRASLIGTVEPVSATITSAVFLGTVFAPTDIAGFALIIAMVFLTV